MTTILSDRHSHRSERYYFDSTIYLPSTIQTFCQLNKILLYTLLLVHLILHKSPYHSHSLHIHHLSRLKTRKSFSPIVSVFPHGLHALTDFGRWSDVLGTGVCCLTIVSKYIFLTRDALVISTSHLSVRPSVLWQSATLMDCDHT